LPGLNGGGAAAVVPPRKYRTEDKLKMDTIHKLNTTRKKRTMQKHSKPKLAWFSHLYDPRKGNKLGLFYNVPEPTQGTRLTTNQKTHSKGS